MALQLSQQYNRSPLLGSLLAARCSQCSSATTTGKWTLMLCWVSFLGCFIQSCRPCTCTASNIQQR